MTIQNVAAQNVFDTQTVCKTQGVNNEQKVNAVKVDLNDPVDQLELSTKEAPKKEASTAKKVGVGVASFMIPGLGQFINGEPKKGVGFLLGNVALAAATVALGPIAAVPAIALEVASVVDAVKNA